MQKCFLTYIMKIIHHSSFIIHRDISRTFGVVRMFQNVTGEFKQEEYEDVELNSRISKADRIKNLFSIQNILIYAISFMVSMVSFNGGIALFSLAIFAAVCSNRIAARCNIYNMSFRYSNKLWFKWIIIICTNNTNFYCFNLNLQTTI